MRNYARQRSIRNFNGRTTASRSLEEDRQVHTNRTNNIQSDRTIRKRDRSSRRTRHRTEPYRKDQILGRTGRNSVFCCIQDMDRLNVKLHNLQNILVQGKKIIPIVRRWGHPWMMLRQMGPIASYNFLTEVEIRQLHRRFGHPSIATLRTILERATSRT